VTGLDDVLKQKTTSQAADGWRKAEDEVAGGNNDPGNLSVSPNVQAIAMQEAPEVMGAMVEGLAGSINKAFEVHTSVTNIIKDIEYQRIEYLRSVENASNVNVLLQNVQNDRFMLDNATDRSLQNGEDPEEVQLRQQEGYVELLLKAKDTLNNTLLPTAAGKENELREDTYRAITNVIGDANAKTAERVFQFKAAKLSAVVAAQGQKIQSDVLVGNMTPGVGHALTTAMGDANPALKNDPTFQASILAQHQAIDANDGFKMMNRDQFEQVLAHANNTKNYLKDDDRQRFIAMANAGMDAREAAKAQASKDWYSAFGDAAMNNMVINNGKPSAELEAAVPGMNAAQRAQYEANKAYGGVYDKLRQSLVGMTEPQRDTEIANLAALIPGMAPDKQLAYKAMLAQLRLDSAAQNSAVSGISEQPNVSALTKVQVQQAHGLTPAPLSKKEVGNLASQVMTAYSSNNPKLLAAAVQSLRNIEGKDANGVPIATYALRQMAKALDKNKYALISAAMVGDMSIPDTVALMLHVKTNGTAGGSNRIPTSDGVPTLMASLAMTDAGTGKPKAGLAVLQQHALFINRLNDERGESMNVEGNAILSSLYEMGIAQAKATGEKDVVKLAAAGMAKVKQVLNGAGNVVEVPQNAQLERSRLGSMVNPAGDKDRTVSTPATIVFQPGVTPLDVAGIPDKMNSYWRQILGSGAGVIQAAAAGKPLAFTGTVPSRPADLQIGINKARNYLNSPFKKQVDTKVQAYANKMGVDPNLVLATLSVESNMKDLNVKGYSDGSAARNAAIGSLGLSQMTTDTRAWLERSTGKKYNLTTVDGSIEAAVDYYAHLAKKGNTKDPILLARMWNGKGDMAERHANVVAGAYNAIVQKGGKGVSGGSQVLADIDSGKGRVVTQQAPDGLIEAYYQAWGSSTQTPILAPNGTALRVSATAIIPTKKE